MRIAIDTAILVRANAKAGGPARELVEFIRESGRRLVASPYVLNEVQRVLNEVQRVLSYPRLQAIYHLSGGDIWDVDKHFFEPNVLSFCSRYRIRVMTDVELLRLLRQLTPPSP